MKGGWRGKTQALYTPDEVMAKTFFGTKPLKPQEIVKKAWDFVKAHSTKTLVKTE